MNYPSPQLLQVLLTFQESKNLVQTAERLKISQPAVTQRLKHLQEQVKIPLYAFEGRKKVLTHYGRALSELARQTFQELEVGFENLNRRYAAPEQLVLRVGGAQELVGLFSELVGFPGRMEHRKMTESQARSALGAEVIDVALCETIADSTELVSRKFFESPSHIIFHRKYFSSAANFWDLRQRPELCLQTPCVLHRLQQSYIDRFCAALMLERKSLNNRAIFEDWYSILSFVESGGGYAVVPGFVQSQSKEVRGIDIPHSVIQRSSYYAIFPRKLKKIESFKKALSFVLRSS